MRIRFALSLCAVVFVSGLPGRAKAQGPQVIEYRVLATNKTSAWLRDVTSAQSKL